MNLATSLLYAVERTPEAEALVGETVRFTYAELRGAPRGSRPVWPPVESGQATGSPASSRTTPRPSSCTGAASGSAPCFVPLSHRISDADLDYCIADCGAEVVVRELRARCMSSSSTRNRGRARPRRA